MRFADQVYAQKITDERATDVYNAHHGYMDGALHNATLASHGLYYQSNLMGAITWRHPLLGAKKFHFDEDGDLMPKYYSEADYDKLPDDMEAKARSFFDHVSEDDITSTEVVCGGKIVEANRICLGERMANLASCGLARSQEFFVDSPDCADKFEYLVTYVRADFDGSMIRALKDKGWTCVGWTPPSDPGNRETKEIHSHYKWCFACPIETVVEQASIQNWC